MQCMISTWGSLADYHFENFINTVKKDFFFTKKFSFQKDVNECLLSSTWVVKHFSKIQY